MIELTVKGYGVFSVEEGSDYEALASRIQPKDDAPIVAVKCGNILKELNQPIEGPCAVEMIDLRHPDGIRIYQRGLSFVMIHSAMKRFPGIKVYVENSLSKGLYCEFTCEKRLNHNDYAAIADEMRALVARDVPFQKCVMTREEAARMFEAQNMTSKLELLKYRNEETVNLYECDGVYDYFYGYMVPSTRYIQYFDLLKYGDGIVLRHPTVDSPNGLPEFIESPKLFDVFKEADEWARLMDVGFVSNLNSHVEDGSYRELVQMAEALHEKKIAYIADRITAKKKRVILIAGPSSSGKTTFANRLRTQLKVNGLQPITLSTDNYFVDRHLTPRDENGDYDFESLAAVDVDLFNKNLNDLLDGNPVDLPVFDFQTGKRTYRNRPVQISENQPIIIEGIHGLNDLLTKDIFKRDKFKIYVSALTQLNIDAHNRIPTTHSRLLRRIVRDNQFRGHSAKRTIGMWGSVRRGEERNIFPFQEEADDVFNSALLYELSVLKKHALPLLEAITPDEPEYGEAVLLIKFLGYFRSIEEDDVVPSVSILKEFIGGSGFDL